MANNERPYQLYRRW